MITVLTSKLTEHTAVDVVRFVAMAKYAPAVPVN